MKQRLLASLICAGLSLNALAADPAPAAAPAEKSDPNKPLVVVNGITLPAVYGNFVRQSRVARGAGGDALSDEAIRDALVNVELLAQEAQRRGLDKLPAVAAAIEFQKKDILGQALIENVLRANPISEETIKKEYERAKAKAGESEYRPRHILVASEKEARDIIAKLTAPKKAKFDDLAKKHSKDSTAGNGGDLGWQLPANLVPEFANAMVKLKKGEVTKDPIQTQFGWHVIQLDDTRKLDFPEYDKLKGRIGGQLQQLQVRKLMQELRATAKVE